MRAGSHTALNINAQPKMKLSPDLKQGTFIDRPNRFSARIAVDGAPVLAHVPNSGRMKELFKENATVFLTPRNGAGRKTAFDVSLVQVDNVLVSSDARLPSALVDEASAKGGLSSSGATLGDAGRQSSPTAGWTCSWATAGCATWRSSQ